MVVPFQSVLVAAPSVVLKRTSAC